MDNEEAKAIFKAKLMADDLKLSLAFVEKQGHTPLQRSFNILLTAAFPVVAAMGVFGGAEPALWVAVVGAWLAAFLHWFSYKLFPTYFMVTIKDSGWSEQILYFICDVLVIGILVMGGWFITAGAYCLGNMYPQYKVWLSKEG